MPGNLFPLRGVSHWEIYLILSVWTSADFFYLFLLRPTSLYGKPSKPMWQNLCPPEREASSKMSMSYEGAYTHKNETTQGKVYFLLCSCSARAPIYSPCAKDSIFARSWTEYLCCYPAHRLNTLPLIMELTKRPLTLMTLLLWTSTSFGSDESCTVSTPETPGRNKFQNI